MTPRRTDTEQDEQNMLIDLATLADECWDDDTPETDAHRSERMRLDAAAAYELRK
jgi:hypothetical protein